MLKELLSGESYDLYQRLIGGEYHALAWFSEPAKQLDKCERELVETGFARVEPGEPPLLVAVPPTVAAQRVLQCVTTQVAAWQQEATQSVQKLMRLEREMIPFQGGTAESLAQLITGPKQILHMVDDIQLSARSELLSFDKSIAAGSHCVPKLSPAAQNPPDQWRTIFTSEYLAPGLSGILDGTVKNGGQVRTSTMLPMKMLIADRAQALVPLDQAGSSGAVLFRSSTVIGALVELFEALWERSSTYPSERHQPSGLTPYEQHVTGLLASGLKDEEIASLTHTSVRTVRRNVASIVEKLSVNTRFAAGVQAAKRGWI